MEKVTKRERKNILSFNDKDFSGNYALIIVIVIKVKYFFL